MKNILFLLLSSFFFFNDLSAQVMGNYAERQQTYQNVLPNAQYRAVPKAAMFIGENSLEISINTLSNQKASAYTAIFSVTQAGKTADETNGLLNTRLSGFLSDLQALGIPAADIYVDMVNFLPKYEYDVSKKLFSKKTYTEIPKGFELQKNVHIRYTKPEQLDDIITKASKQEIYDLVKVDYFDDNPQKVYKELRERSFQYLNEIKAAYRTIHLGLDTAYVLAAENTWVAFPGNRYESYQAYSTQSFEAIEKGASINTLDKPTSRFYNAVPANDYDIIVNPEVVEPVIQYSYNLIARFTLNEPPKSPKAKSYFWLTPEGEVRELKME